MAAARRKSSSPTPRPTPRAEIGRKFGVMIVVEGGHQFQVATFRAEADYQDGRRPEKIIFANAEADASRRDRQKVWRDDCRGRRTSISGRHVSRRGGLSGWPPPGENHLRQRRGRRLAPRSAESLA